ncbi:histidinol-phosphatase [Mycolicibacterium phlei]|jgi:histidinol-phosphatase (PHP family)|uniref:Histidinol-phosphatase n=1 Tax=Mycolicibacterium phlei DSM 43239 = CCUG 21000 TaxID=1226750 RepID=A0A5N5V2S9_MYCPH|nr:PHP domain-containing protein [Mycolicibacterium phlei]VEG10728.1 histidinol-phosphatase [Mycobacteroides chelonae]AMO62627.1 Histidinol-phosphatase [Mycolicibacterium phlei]EID11615.1 histidinol phosphatase of PHP family protein [Mycolicibacterium phlei RIVM601174]KAB7756201.1 histidinol phosphatase [Mycolicibacterium phlei DSM 43239 = CCUG 21000]KXW61458.1 histidinol phosphatase [Mycolicibacterium phlei DSM 43239 = CCUG 21000]
MSSLPTDSHVHSEWSWDAPSGSMLGSCARAVELGLPAIAFTEHVDHTVWTPTAEELENNDYPPGIADGGAIVPPAFDTVGYLAALQECRDRYPQLRILSGLELGEPHWHSASVREVLAAGPFDRVLGSLHCLADRGGFAEPDGLFEHRDPFEVIRSYLAEVAELVCSSEPFEILAHIDYPVRDWPASAGPFDPVVFEEEFRHALRCTAESGRALEINTVVPLNSHILRWWHEEGGQSVSFGSDAHEPEAVARGFARVADFAQAHGFRPGPDPFALWTRQD